MAKKIKTLDGAEGEIHPHEESELDDEESVVMKGPYIAPAEEADQAPVEETDLAPEPALDPFTQYINGELQWFRRASFGDQRGYHTAATVQSRGFLLLAELLIALEHRLRQIELSVDRNLGNG